MPKPINLLDDLAAFGAEQRISLRDPVFRQAFGDHVGSSVDRALSDPIWLHGHRVEAMFEALLVALGDYKLLKLEDAGRVYPTRGLKVPDYRVVLADGEQCARHADRMVHCRLCAEHCRRCEEACREAIRSIEYGSPRRRS